MMPNVIKFFILAVVSVANVVHCSAFAFQQQRSLPTTTASSLYGASKKQSYEEIPSTQTEIIHNINAECSTAGADTKPVLATRRNAMNSCLSLLTMATCLPLREAVASDEDTSLQPFTVIFSIQVDSKKPDELSELEIEVRPDWAPLAADRFKQLIELGFYKDCPFFRVLPGYIAQFGVSANPDLNKEWMYCDTAAGEEVVKLCKQPLPDEPRTQPNKRGTLSFATSGKNTRRTQIFINSGNNGGPPNFLDAQNFVPFARIVRGMEDSNNIVKQLNGEYGGKVNQGKAAYYGGEYFEKVFPRLSVIRDAKII
eukprot:CAMPEP_0172319040 /NCGR_PEP_ID=MMETSP1058-20130122/36613_1 /TAXON_ID=83371 /ORGANISM="Detonula confervacea, Strain CCMP 353" /LENGTH=311 /DNA_ID=CAMNT_0013033983 /DNA_START=47 /DNA_END=982 /DNA_ORIENTATION=+